MRLFTLLFLSLAACPTPIDEPTDGPTDGPTEDPVDLAEFATATEMERAGAVQAALGFGGVWSSLVQMQADMDARSVDEENRPSGCPMFDELSDSPLTVRYEADGCTGPSGAVWDGLLEAENPLTWEDAGQGPSGPMGIVAEGFSMDDGMVPSAFDGSWRQTETAWGADSVASYDLVATVGPQTWTLVGDMHLVWEDGVTHTTCADGLEGAVEGLGAFDVACDLTDFGGENPAGFVELTGKDTFRVEFTPDVNGCLPTSIDGLASAPLCSE